MIVIVDEEKHSQMNRRFRQAPPVANDVRRPHHGAPSGANSNLQTRMDDLDFTGDDRRDDYGQPSRVASPYGERIGERGAERNGMGAQRNIFLDAMRSPPSPRRSMNEQRAVNNQSSKNSLKDNKYGHGNSVDSFQI